MTVSTHKDLAGLNIHTPVTWEVADATARLAIAATSIDIHKIAWQLDTNESWFLVSVAPNVWKQFAGPAGPTGATGATGAGVIIGGTAGQVLAKINATDYNTQWKTLTKSDVGLSNVPNVDATQRANHTGTQTASTISDFDSAADARVAIGITAHEAAPDPHPQYTTNIESIVNALIFG